jgi:hypothetical protein
MIVFGTLLLAWNSFARAAAPWWALWLGNGLLILGSILPLRRAYAAQHDATVAAKANDEEQE